MKIQITILFCTTSILAACGGGSSSNFNTSNIVGRTFQETAASVEIVGSRFDSTADEAVSVEFVSETAARLTTPNGTYTLFRDDSDGFYRDIPDNVSFLPGTQLRNLGETPDMIFFSVLEFNQALRDKAYYFVDGNRTSTGNLPTDAGARYVGTSFMINGAAGSSTSGVVTVDVNFVSGNVTGNVTDPLPNSSADFALAPTTLNGGTFDTTLTSTNTTVTDSSIDGRVFGNSGNQLGGGFRIESSDGNGAGFYGATKQ